VGNTLSGKELLPDPVSLVLCNVERGEEGWVVEAVARNAAACPDCGIWFKYRKYRKTPMFIIFWPKVDAFFSGQ
jgi:hypothetical protein